MWSSRKYDVVMVMAKVKLAEERFRNEFGCGFAGGRRRSWLEAMDEAAGTRVRVRVRVCFRLKS